jgi:PST family polysaccharide transporter
MMLKSLGWGSAMAGVRLLTSFLSIKVTAVALGPGGLVLVAQLTSFIGLCQSMLGQGLVAGAVRLGAEQGAGHGAEHAANRAARGRVYATVLRMGVVMVGVWALVVAAVSPWLAEALLHDRRLAPVVAVAGLAVAAAIFNDLVFGALGVAKEVGLIGRASIASALLGLLIFASCAWWWGLDGALWACLMVYVAGLALSIVLVRWRSRGLRWSDLQGRFDPAIARQVLGFFPMLVVNGVLPALTLILVRDLLASELGLDAAGLWQASWRLSEACQALVVASVSLHFMPGMGERAHDPEARRRHVLRTLGGACAVSALLAAALWLGREPAVRLVFSAGFDGVIDLLPLQVLGDVLKTAAWILSMALVGTLRTAWFITAMSTYALTFIALSWQLVPMLGTAGAQWAYGAAALLQGLVATWALRDVLWRPQAHAAPIVDGPGAAGRVGLS